MGVEMAAGEVVGEEMTCQAKAACEQTRFVGCGPRVQPMGVEIAI